MGRSWGGEALNPGGSTRSRGGEVGGRDLGPTEGGEAENTVQATRTKIRNDTQRFDGYCMH